jgi:YggT family protein
MGPSLIDKLNLFVDGLATVAVILVVGLVLLRVLAGYANLNFFGATYVTLRRLADPLIGPVRRALMGFRVDPKFAPLVTILIAILLWWVLTTAIDSIFGTVAGVLLAVQQHATARIIGHLLLGLLRLYTLLIFLRVVFSWVMMSQANKVMRFLFNASEPLLGPLRRAIPPVGMFDISAFVALLILWVVQMAIQGAFLR